MYATTNQQFRHQKRILANYQDTIEDNSHEDFTLPYINAIEKTFEDRMRDSLPKSIHKKDDTAGIP